MELQLVKKYDARAWDGVVVPLGEGNLNSYQGPWVIVLIIKRIRV